MDPLFGRDPALPDRLARSLGEMVDEAEHLLKNAQRSGSEQFIAARDRLESRVKQARSELDDLREGAARSLRRAARSADGAVHEHPYTTAGLAAGVGLLVGLLIARR